MAASELASQLTQAGYHGLFRPGATFDADRGTLEEIVAGDGFDDLARLFAAEVLFRVADGYPPEGERGTLAGIYARALALTGAGDRALVLTGNAWGFLYENDEGPLGEHLRAIGPAAIPHLRELLDDDAPLFYEGSQEAMLGAELAYRVKDAAAYYIGVLSGRPVPFHRDVSERDAEIARLRDA